MKPEIHDRILVKQGHLRGFYGTVTEEDNGDGYGIAIDNCIIFVRIPEEDFEVARTQQQKFLAGTRAQRDTRFAGFTGGL